nr:ABC transporter permease [Acidobacteriota bacterium]
GLLLALWGTSLIEALGSRMLPLLGHVEIDARVLGFTVLISILTAVVFGLAPALHASRPDLNDALKESGRGSSGGPGRSRLRGALVVSEIALSLVLLICAGLLIKSVMRLRNVNPGFNPDNLLTMNVWLPSAKYPKAPAWLGFYDQMLQRIKAVPGVQAAGVVSVLPLSTNFDGRTLEVEGQPKAPGESPEVELYIATPDYLRAMEIPTLKGRALSEQDGVNAPHVALLSETMARRFWPNEDPLGKRIRFLNSDPEEKRPWKSVVGVVSDVKQKGLDAEGTMQFYLPLAQQPSSAMTLVVRTAAAPSTMIAPVRREILALDQDQAAFNIATMDQLRAESTALRRFSMSLLALFAGVALTLAAVGIYGVIAYSVTQRTHEIGIRLALGAETRDVLKLVVGQGLKLAVLGVGLGLIAAFALTRVLSSLLYGVSATDPVIFTSLSLLLAVVALLACLIPARRATKVDPMVALRYE